MALVTEDMAKGILPKLRTGETTLREEVKRLSLKSPGPLRRALMKTLGCTEEALQEMLAKAEKRKGSKARAPTPAGSR